MIDFSKIPLFLAPMANFTDLPFRAVVKKFGADVTISEMISANALVFESKKTLKMLECADIEKPFIVQIAGNSDEIIKKAVQMLNSLDFIDGIDFNCGCPAPKIVRQNAGSALLRELDLLKKLVSTIKESSKKQTTSVKFRLGFDEKITPKIALVCEAAGADFVAIHGRSAKQMYRGKCDYTAIAQAKAAVKIPVIANGDINAQNAAQILAQTHANALMIGRAAVGKPWIFTQIRTILKANLSENFGENHKFKALKSLNSNENLALNLGEKASLNLNENSLLNLKNSSLNLAGNSPLNPAEISKFEVSKTLKKEIILFHFEMMIRHFGEYGVVLFRKHLHEYSKSIEGAAIFREKINHTSEISQMQKEIEGFFDKS